MTQRATDIEHLSYRPARPYPYDLEIFLVSDLKRRTAAEAMRRTYSYEFHMLICIIRGRCSQLVDFEPISCSAGDVVTIRPGQAHNFGNDEDWDGWIVLFRPEFLLPATSAPRDLRLVFDLERLPSQLTLAPDELGRATQAILRMREDSLIETSSPPTATGLANLPYAADLTADIQALMRYQLYALVSWLTVVHVQRGAQGQAPSGSLQRFDRFKKLVEQHFTAWRQVSDYANHMGCTEKSLTRATWEAVGVSAKVFISRRVALEAKRLLAYTDLPVADVAEKLGFPEPTHFSKFFRRETSFPPSTFRKTSDIHPIPRR
ncbi:MAG TPA: AraC family transcriptional regulator [Caulobacter sp.]|nr:AraC family transcriptional regulator [Caulobacter sp.]